MATASRGRILLVGNAGRLDARARALGQAGFEVKAVPTATGARLLFEKERFDAVLGEVTTPRTGASPLVGAIRQVDKGVPVILMTDAPKMGSPGADVEIECLPRRVAPAALERTLDRAVRRIRRWRSIAAYRNRRGDEVEIASFTATDAKNEFGQVLEKATDGIVVITRHDEPQAVLLSFDEFNDLAGARESKLEALGSEFDALLARMQTPKARKGMKKAFEATPVRMGEAAVAAARKRG